MKQHLPLVLSSAALVVAVFGATPLGHAAGQLVQTVPPFAKKAGYAAKAGVAKNALALNRHKASTTPGPGTIPVLDTQGKLPASIGAVGPQGPPGPPGSLDTSQYYTKSQVDAKLTSLTGSSVVDGSLTLKDLGGTDANNQTTTVSSAIALASGQCKAELTANYGDGVVGDMVVGTLTDANGNAVLPNTAAVMPSIVIKTSQGGAVPNLIVCNTGASSLTIPAGSVFRWRLIDA